MTFTQQTFLGASIRGWTSQLGWGSETSSITVQLVEDAQHGDIFNPPDVGFPVFFSYNSFNFAGLLQSAQYKGGQDGNPLYEVTVVDPRQIFEGVQIILSNFNGTTRGVPNLFNVYGYLENALGFGGSGRNEAGIPYTRVVTALNAIVNGSSTDYGSFISYRGSRYRVDLSNLPPIPPDYRIGGESISLMDFIREVCTIGGSEDSFFFRLEGDIIKLYIVYRGNNPVIGAITRFIVTTPGAVAKSVGTEMRNQTTSKFLVGGDVEEIFLQTYDDQDTQTESDDTIWPFWGIDQDSNVIIGEGRDDDHKFTIDSRRINIPGMTPTYTIDVAELRAALYSRESWEFFLMNKNDEDGIHFGKADRLRIRGNIKVLKTTLESIVGELEGDDLIDALANISPVDLYNAKKQAIDLNNPDVDDDALYIDEYIGMVYDMVRTVATEFYGKRFMVRVPHLYSFSESETGTVIVSQEPTDSGFLDESQWSEAVNRNLLPQDVDFMTNQENKIQAYVRFDNAENLDLTEIGPDDMIFHRNTGGGGNKKNAQGLSVFIKCSVEPNIYYVNASTFFSPRAIITLPGAVREFVGDERTSYDGVFSKALVSFLESRDITDQNSIKAVKNDFLTKFGANSLYFGEVGIAYIPDLVAVPLRSKVNTYGPWSAVGGDGKVDFQQDTSLVPWNFGGFQLMNLAGTSAVNSAISSQFVSEAGSIEFPDVPAINLGDLLISGGPYVTDINVTVGRDGVRTTYRMQIWTPTFGRVPQSMIDRMQRIVLGQRRLRKQVLDRRRVIPGNVTRIQRAFGGQVNRKENKSPHGVIVGEVTRSDGYSNVSVYLQPFHEAIGQIGNNYAHKAIASLDSIFVPFSTRYDYSGNMPHMEQPSELITDDINATSLNPFDTNNKTALMSYGPELPEDLSLRTATLEQEDFEDFRAMALRAPLMLAGFGIDSSGFHTPSGTDYKSNVGNWKVGPLDARWDNTKKLWTAGSTGATLLRATAINCCSGKVEASYPGIANSGDIVAIDTWLGGPMCSGQRLLLAKDNTKYYVVNIQYSALTVVTGINCETDETEVCSRVIYLPAAYSAETCDTLSEEE